MDRRIVHYFSPMSGYAYLGIGELDAVRRRRGATVVHRPLDIVRVFAEVGAIAPARQSPERMAWRRLDMRRWAKRRRLPLVDPPRFWPVDGKLASCAIIAAQNLQLDAMRLARELLACVWAQDRDISRGATIIAAAQACGFDGEKILREAASFEAQAEYERNTQDAIAAGVIGSPTYFLGEDMFFGQDRLDFLDAALGCETAARVARPIGQECNDGKRNVQEQLLLRRARITGGP